MIDLDRVSFQMWSARNAPPLDTQLATLAAIGYRNVEPYGGLFDDPAALRASLKRHNLDTPTAHLGIEHLRDDLAGITALARDFGIGLLVVPAVDEAERGPDAAGWRKLGAELARHRKALAAHGIELGWHNHDFEFRELPDGSVPLDHLFDAAPGLRWEADIGWMVWGGEDPAKWIAKYADRVAAVHIKDIAPKGENLDEQGQADVGHGTIDWAALQPVIGAKGIKYLVIEHDNPSDFERFARRSFETVSTW